MTIDDSKLNISNTICYICKHYTYDATCRAYPDGIPQEIVDGTMQHVLPYKNDKGILFQTRK